MTANGKTVLLVEDNEDNRIVYSTILRHFGYSVTEALNGEEGIAKARAEKPDLILMDISIPVIDGWEATQVLKHDPQTRQIPIIALTAHALASDREKAIRRPSCEIAGSVAFGTSRVADPPREATFQIPFPPPRSETNAIVEPSGNQAGSRSLAAITTMRSRPITRRSAPSRR